MDVRTKPHTSAAESGRKNCLFFCVPNFSGNLTTIWRDRKNEILRRGDFWDFRSIFCLFFWKKFIGAIFQPAKFLHVPTKGVRPP